MGCCGGGRSPAALPQSSPQRMEMNMPGLEGMTAITYIGGNAGTMEWYGAASKIRYVFGGARSEGWVDDRDAGYFTGLRENGQPVFVIKGEPVPEPDAPPAPDGLTQAKTDEGALTVTSSGAANEQGEIVDLDGAQERPVIADLTLVELKELILDPYQWELMMDDEEKGKNRVGHIQFIKSKLDAKTA